MSVHPVCIHRRVATLTSDQTQCWHVDWQRVNVALKPLQYTEEPKAVSLELHCSEDCTGGMSWGLSRHLFYCACIVICGYQRDYMQSLEPVWCSG